MKSGLVVILSAPSGVGKSSVCKEILQREERAVLSVSYTTREPRPGEIHGRDYFFIDSSDFKEMIEDNLFIEWAEVHGNLYGTGEEETLNLLRSEKIVIFDVDIRGARALRDRFPKESLSIFLLPPSWQALVERLTQRGTEDFQKVWTRLKTARKELPYAGEYDYIFINDQLEDTVRHILELIKLQKFRSEKMASKLSQIVWEMEEFFYENHSPEDIERSLGSS